MTLVHSSWSIGLGYGVLHAIVHWKRHIALAVQMPHYSCVHHLQVQYYAGHRLGLQPNICMYITVLLLHAVQIHIITYDL